MGIIQSLDKPISPGSRALSAYFWKKSHLTEEKRQSFRNKLLQSSREEVQSALKQHIGSLLDKSVLVTFTNSEMIAKENQLLKTKNFNPLEALPII